MLRLAALPELATVAEATGHGEVRDMGMGIPTHANAQPIPLPLGVCTPGKG